MASSNDFEDPLRALVAGWTTSEPPFALGDVVQAKMGGPLMTVEKCEPGDFTWFDGARPTKTKAWIIRTAWFDASNHLHREAFDQAALKPEVQS